MSDTTQVQVGKRPGAQPAWGFTALTTPPCWSPASWAAELPSVAEAATLCGCAALLEQIGKPMSVETQVLSPLHTQDTPRQPS